MSVYDLLILIVFIIFALDIVGPRLYQAAQWWFDNFGPEEEPEVSDGP